MSSYRYPRTYDPKLIKKMRDALDSAWRRFEPKPKDAELAQSRMGKAIIAAVDTGTVESAVLVDKAARALRVSIMEDQIFFSAVRIRERERRDLRVGHTT